LVATVYFRAENPSTVVITEVLFTADLTTCAGTAGAVVWLECLSVSISSSLKFTFISIIVVVSTFILIVFIVVVIVIVVIVVLWFGLWCRIWFCPYCNC